MFIAYSKHLGCNEAGPARGVKKANPGRHGRQSAAARCAVARAAARCAASGATEQARRTAAWARGTATRRRLAGPGGMRGGRAGASREVRRGRSKGTPGVESWCGGACAGAMRPGPVVRSASVRTGSASWRPDGSARQAAAPVPRRSGHGQGAARRPGTPGRRRGPRGPRTGRRDEVLTCVVYILCPSALQAPCERMMTFFRAGFAFAPRRAEWRRR